MNLLHSPASDKQIAFASKLVGEVVPLRGTDPLRVALCEILRDTWAAAAEDSWKMSSYIDALLNCKKTWANEDAKARIASRTAPVAPAEEPEAGVYWINGDHLVRVYLGQNAGKMLVKRINVERDGDLTDVSYEYMGLATRFLTPAANPVRLSLEEVGSLGVSFGHCMICGRRLDDPESVDRGIGPVCASKY